MADKTTVAPTVAPMDSTQKNSPVSGPIEDETTVMLDAAASTCFWNGQQFDEDAMVECDGAAYECTFGRWVRVG